MDIVFYLGTIHPVKCVRSGKREGEITTMSVSELNVMVVNEMEIKLMI